MFKDLETLGIYAFLLLVLVVVTIAIKSARDEGLKGSPGFGTMRVDAMSGGASTANLSPPIPSPPPEVPPPAPAIMPVPPANTNQAERPGATNHPALPRANEPALPRF